MRIWALQICWPVAIKQLSFFASRNGICGRYLLLALGRNAFLLGLL
ncbi:hypothetical protein NG798_15740 [Ancylothrix sp. C2]|nr:hypothetical protein [Ancylothrix sp. D3o]